MHKKACRIQTPVAWPRSGPVSRLYLNAVSGHGVSVYITQSNWPRQTKNRHWQICIDGIDPRYAQDTRDHIQSVCLSAAQDWLSAWLAAQAPILDVQSASWQDLVRFSTQSRPKALPERKYTKRRAYSRSPTSTDNRPSLWSSEA